MKLFPSSFYVYLFILIPVTSRGLHCRRWHSLWSQSWRSCQRSKSSCCPGGLSGPRASPRSPPRGSTWGGGASPREVLREEPGRCQGLPKGTSLGGEGDAFMLPGEVVVPVLHLQHLSLTGPHVPGEGLETKSPGIGSSSRSETNPSTIGYRFMTIVCSIRHIGFLAANPWRQRDFGIDIIWTWNSGLYKETTEIECLLISLIWM